MTVENSRFTLRRKMDELEFIVQNGFSSKVDTINAPCKLVFNEEPNQLYGFDKYETHFKDKYQKIHFNGEDYYIPWKSLKTGTTDKVLLDFTCIEESGIVYENVKFKSSMGLTISSTYNDGTFTLTIPAAMNNDVDKIEAYIEDGDNTITLGRLNSVSFDMINQEVVIVPVGGNILPNSITAQQVQTELNKIYKGAIVNWTVTLDNSLNTLQPSEWDNNTNNLLNCEVSDYFAYTAEMNNLIDHFNEKSVVDDEKLYLFLVYGDEAQEKNGIMPFGKQFGFIMVGGTKNQSLQQLTRTIAHELGHGAFGLMHSWQEFNGVPAQGTTDNLMDYSTGTKLRKYQWYYIHNPRWHFGGGEEDEVTEEIEPDPYIIEFPKLRQVSNFVLGQLWVTDRISASIVTLSLLITSKYDVTVAFGPSVTGHAGGGLSFGTGYVVSPGGIISIYGDLAPNVGYTASVSATYKLTFIYGGLESFSGNAYAVSFSGGELIVGGIIPFRFIKYSNLLFVIFFIIFGLNYKSTIWLYQKK